MHVMPDTSNADPMPQEKKVAWFEYAWHGYARLAPGADPDAVAVKIKPIIDRLVDPQKDGLRDMSAVARCCISAWFRFGTCI